MAVRHLFGVLRAAVVLGAAFIGVGSAFAVDYTIVLDKMKFGALPAKIHAGDTIVWQNDDIFRHSATARDKSFDVDLPAKTSARMVVRDAGIFEFFCKFHPGMKGVLVVSQ